MPAVPAPAVTGEETPEDAWKVWDPSWRRKKKTEKKSAAKNNCQTIKTTTNTEQLSNQAVKLNTIFLVGREDQNQLSYDQATQLPGHLAAKNSCQTTETAAKTKQLSNPAVDRC